MKSPAIILSCILFSLTAFTQVTWFPQTDIVSELNSATLVDLGPKGNIFSSRISQLSFNQLDSILQYGNPVAKVYGFWGYLKKKDSDFRKYFVQLIVDTSKVSFHQYGCLFERSEEVGAVIFEMAINERQRYGIFTVNDYFLDSMSFKLDDRVAIANLINVRIGNLKPPSPLYGELRERALAGEIYAKLGLANFQRESDLPIFHKQLQREGKNAPWGMECVIRFPHPSFEEYVLRKYYKALDDPYARGYSYITMVLLNYKSPAAISAFDSVITYHEKYSNHLISLWMMLNLEKYKGKFDDLKKKIVKSVGRKELKRRVEEYDWHSLNKKASENRTY